jgi:hypothetical protein
MRNSGTWELRIKPAPDNDLGSAMTVLRSEAGN